MRAFALLLLLGCATAVPPPAASLSPVPVGGRDGPASLPELSRGRPMVVDFFATWCEPCKKSMPELASLARERAGTDLLVVGVAVGEGWDVVAPFVSAMAVDYPVYVDPDFAFADAMGAPSVPTLLVVDRRGQVVHRGRTLDGPARAALERASR